MAALLKRLILRWCPEPLLVALKKAHYSRVLRDATAIEEPDFPVVRRLVAPGDRVLDIGANIGVYTKLLAEQVGPGGRVWSIEPIPVTWRILQHNARALGLANVEALNCAASDSDGTVTMEVPPFETGGENFYEAHIIETPGDPPPVPTAAGRPPRRLRRVTVQTRRLDSLFPDGSEPVSFVKCD
ncbi:MAG: FkbM family methyltransferase, partial [bacterium]|nr:FkbM family methyltransferase [bacterium]